ncbi:MAG: iron-sulfur cluster repair di-iron protein [Bacteroidetes bacterium]|nr:MAG: iron-sulfur cluster repair di-iron protein [Bacteroidota bacterium]
MDNNSIFTDTGSLKALHVGHIVTHNYRAADVFKKHNIDFCCGGKISIEDVCVKKKVDATQLIEELIMVLSTASLPSQNFASWEAGFLADYIVNTHHNYVRTSVDILNSYLQKLVRVHGERHPELGSTQAYFIALANELLSHMEKEENVLFPFIKQLTSSADGSLAAKGVELNGPIACMEQEHEYAGKLMQNINNLSNGYTPPEDACTTYRVCYLKLKEFEDDLHQHIHLENNILFPQALTLLKNLERVPEYASCSIPINLHTN